MQLRHSLPRFNRPVAFATAQLGTGVGKRCPRLEAHQRRHGELMPSHVYVQSTVSLIFLINGFSRRNAQVLSKSPFPVK